MRATHVGMAMPVGLYAISGVLTELHVALDKKNLLACIDRHDHANSAVTSLSAHAAAAAAVAMVDEEDTEHFVCLIGEQVVCGTFGGASKLPVGKEVTAVVRRHADVLVAEGILSDSEGLVWVRHARGATAEMWVSYKLAAYCFGFSTLCMTLGIYFLGTNPSESKLASLAWSVLPCGLLCFGMAWWDSPTIDEADPATEVFRLLGFADPDKVNLNRYQYGIVHMHELVHATGTRANYANIHCYKKAVEEGVLAMAPP